MLIPQRTHHDCAICCMAMVTGRSYEDVLATVGDTFDPERGMRRDQEAMKRLGFSYTFDNGEPVGDITFFRRGYEISPEYFLRHAWGRRALLTVPSLNKEGGWHMVYWDGLTLFDPSSRTRYERFVDLKPTEMILFLEAR
jgi:hypothetical protein